MSVAAYLKKVEEGIQKKIKENLDFAEKNPYPAEDLKKITASLGEKSVLAKIYGPNGELIKTTTVSPKELAAAKDEANVIPGLWKRLQDGQRGLTKKKATETTLLSINPKEELNAAYSKFYSGIKAAQSKGSIITFDELFKISDSEFLNEVKNALGISLNSFGAEDLVKAAFIEIYEKDISGNISKKETFPPQTGTSPVNTGDLTKPKTEGAETNPGTINAGKEKKKEATSVTSSEGQVTSKPGEISKEILQTETKSPQTINVNLEPTKSPGAISTDKEKIESNTILNTNEKLEKSEKILEKTAESTEVKSTAASVNTETAKESQESTSSNGAVNQPKEEKKKDGFLSKLGKISNAIGSALNLPTFKELGSQATGLFGATGAKFMSNVSDISQSFNRSSINSNINQKRETSDNTTSTTSNESNVSSSNTFSTTDNTQNATMNLEKNSPSMTAENTSTTVSNQTNTSGSQMQSTTNASTAPTTVTSASNQTILPSTPTNQSPSQGQSIASSSPGMSVDLSSLSQSISRLEKILVSGIEVTIKDT